MANKRFFWLKLQEDFFQQKAMKKLRRMGHGEVLTIIYLKMQLASLRNGGVIVFEGFGDSLPEELSLQLDEDENDVRTTVEFLVRCGLMEQVNGADTYILPGAVENTGSESDSAARMRALRERTSSQCDDGASPSDGASHCDDRVREEKSREELEKIQSREEGEAAAAPPTPARDSRNLIFLDDAQYKRLLGSLGEAELKRCVDYLSEYCAMKGKKYKDWSAAIEKCHREGWGLKSSGQGSAPSADFQPDTERIKKNNEWLDSFLAEQQGKGKNGKWNLEATEL